MNQEWMMPPDTKAIRFELIAKGQKFWMNGRHWTKTGDYGAREDGIEYSIFIKPSYLLVNPMEESKP